MTHLLRFTANYAMARLFFAVVVPVALILGAIIAAVFSIAAIGFVVQVWHALS